MVAMESIKKVMENKYLAQFVAMYSRISSEKTITENKVTTAKYGSC